MITTHSTEKMPNLCNKKECGPLLILEKVLAEQQTAIETWLRKQWRLTPPPITSSVDLRNAGFKIAPVDTNLFPAGYNNLNREFLPLCIQAAQAALENTCPNVVRILIVPENHTRNTFYYESLATLHEILVKAGFETHIGTLRSDVTKAEKIVLPSQREIVLQPIQRKNDVLQVENFIPCLILLNNDLAEGIPEILQNIKQTVLPSPQLGWSTRLKSQHFTHYQKVAEEFSNLLKIDSWFINPLFRNCGSVDFMKREGEECLIDHAEKLFTQINSKYAEYNIQHKPFIMIKADAGSYGMGVMKIDDPAQIKNLNRKDRTRMATSKGNNPITKVILQEGVYTFESWGDQQASAEPVVYMISHHVIGGFYRVHAARKNNENLNAPGMQFESLAFQNSCIDPNCYFSSSKINRMYIYGVIARLALVAAARELAEVKK